VPTSYTIFTRESSYCFSAS